jgi:hypothetical protein
MVLEKVVAYSIESLEKANLLSEEKVLGGNALV